MNKLATLTLAAALLMATGCAKPVMKQWQAAGGSRADATVTVGYSYNPNSERPEANSQQALSEARKRCQAWGYQEAEPFGMVSRHCSDMVYTVFGPQCMQMTVTQQFQCLGRGDAYVPSGNDPAFVGPIKPKK